MPILMNKCDGDKQNPIQITNGLTTKHLVDLIYEKGHPFSNQQLSSCLLKPLLITSHSRCVLFLSFLSGAPFELLNFSHSLLLLSFANLHLCSYASFLSVYKIINTDKTQNTLQCERRILQNAMLHFKINENIYGWVD